MVSKYEVKAQKELEKEGYTVDNKRGMGRFAKNRDYFHRFDLCAVKKGQSVRWISIKGHGGIPKEHYQSISTFWLPKGNIKEIWYWPKRKKKMEGFIKKIIL